MGRVLRGVVTSPVRHVPRDVTHPPIIVTSSHCHPIIVTPSYCCPITVIPSYCHPITVIASRCHPIIATP